MGHVADSPVRVTFPVSDVVPAAKPAANWYAVRGVCGIPSITLEGNPEDWRRVAAGAREFARLGPDWWADPLGPVLGQFAAAADGDELGWAIGDAAGVTP